MSKVNDVRPLPGLIEIEPARGRNLRCTMCHVPHEKGKPEYIDLDLLEKSTRGLRDCNVIIGSEYEPTIHPEFSRLLRLAIDRNWKVDFLTNGVKLNRVDKNILADVNFNVFNLSFDGATDKTYARIRVGANFTKVIDNVGSVIELVKKNGAYTAVNATLMKSSLDETVELVEMWDKFGFDLVRLLLMQARSPSISVLKESLYSRRKDLVSVLQSVSGLLAEQQLRIGVRNGYYGSADFELPSGLNLELSTIYSDNPGYRHVPAVRQDLQQGEWPGMVWPCKSPFVYCRIRWDGVVDLCNNRKFVIGHIGKDSIKNIWNNPESKKLRERILSSIEICDSCDYYRFCIASRLQDINDKRSHFASGLISHPIVVNL